MDFPGSFHLKELTGFDGGHGADNRNDTIGFAGF
jgi:hypothetical protein